MAGLEQLTAAIAGALGRPGIALDLDAGMDVTAGWDSLKNMEVLLAVEAAFQTRFTAEELMSLQSVRGLHQALQAKGLLPADPA